MSETRKPVEVELRNISEPTIHFTECGHLGAKEFALKIFGHDIHHKVGDQHIQKTGNKETVDGPCPSCFADYARQFAIPCCLCGEAILPGEGVALYQKSSDGVEKEGTEFVGNSVIGCLRMECCPSGGFYAGHWTEEGFSGLEIKLVPLDEVDETL